MAAQSPPTLHKLADRSYDVLSDVDELIAFLNLLFDYAGAGKPTDLYQHRWYHVGAEGKTVLVLFKSHPPGTPPRLSLLGPHIAAIDALASAEVQHG
jgi:hypothetical protein